MTAAHDVHHDPTGALALLDECEVIADDGWYIIRHPDGRRLSSPPVMMEHPYLGTTFVPSGIARRWRTKAEAVEVIDVWRGMLNQALARAG